MGATSHRVLEGTKTIDVIKKELDPKFEIVAHNVSKRGAVYLAIKNISTGVVSAEIILVTRQSKQHYNFTSKWMSEEMGPYHFEPSLKVLNALTPTKNETAQNWRKRSTDTLRLRRRVDYADFTGKIVELYEKRYHVTGKGEKGEKGYWRAIGEHDGKLYRLVKSQWQSLKVVGEWEATENRA